MPGSLAENVSVGATSTIVEPSAGPDAIVVSGGVVSIVHVCVAAALTWRTSGGSSWAWNTARTENVCVPSASPAKLAPAARQGSNGRASSLHSKLSADPSATCADLLEV